MPIRHFHMRSLLFTSGSNTFVAWTITRKTYAQYVFAALNSDLFKHAASSCDISYRNSGGKYRLIIVGQNYVRVGKRREWI